MAEPNNRADTDADQNEATDEVEGDTIGEDEATSASTTSDDRVVGERLDHMLDHIFDSDLSDWYDSDIDIAIDEDEVVISSARGSSAQFDEIIARSEELVRLIDNTSAMVAIAAGSENTHNGSNSTGVLLGPKATPNQRTIQRLQKELKMMETDPPPGCSAKLKGDDIYLWEATIKGPYETPYEGGVFKLQMEFRNGYPFVAPRVKFITRIFHCNIHRTGIICLDILHAAWSPAYTVHTILLSIYCLLSDCNPSDPFEQDIAKLYNTEKEKHDAKAKEYTKRYAMPDKKE